MKVTIDPPMQRWRPRVPDAALIAHRRDLGLSNPTRPVIATGHQAWHWHPGILSKYLAAAAFAQRSDATVLNLIVDQDVYDPLRLDLPVRDGARLAVTTIELARCDASVPPGVQPPVPQADVRAGLDAAVERLGDRLLVNLGALRQAWSEPIRARSLAEQVAAVLHRLMQARTGAISAITATGLMQMPPSRAVIDLMLRDPASCARHYNEAVAAHPSAGVAPLMIERERIELPMWWLRPGEPRLRIFADIADSKPLLIDETGEPIPYVSIPLREMESDHRAGRDGYRALSPTLAPRALLLTGLMRAYYCDLFIHGLGGGVYDRVTETWWRNWAGQELAPLAVVSADVQLPFPGIPVADRAQLSRAVWSAHHLPHNLDRLLPPGAVDPASASRKRDLLAHMDDDRDRKRRAALFREIHGINRQLAAQHAEVIALAEQQVERARIGVENRAAAAKRDWCFALYPKEQLDALQTAIAR